MGTGSTISGVGKFLKEKNPKVQVIGVDPLGSILKDFFYKKEPMKAHTYKIEGIGEDFVPESTWFDTIDEIVKVGDKEAYLMTRRLAREEGVLAGSSSGAAVVAARRIAETLDRADVMVVLLPDTGERYLSKAHNEEWLKEQGYLEEPVAPLMTILRAKERTIPGVVTVDIAAKVREAADMMRQYNVSQLPVMDTGILVGSLREEILMKALLQNPKLYDDYVAKVMEKPFPIVEPDARGAATEPRGPRGGQVCPLVLERHGGHHDLPHATQEGRPRRRDGRLLRRCLPDLHADHEQLRDRIELRRPARPRRRGGRLPAGDSDAVDPIADEPLDEGRLPPRARGHPQAG